MRTGISIFGWVRLTRYEEMRNRYEECRATAQATINELHKIIDFADLRIAELEAERDRFKLALAQALESRATAKKRGGKTNGTSEDIPATPPKPDLPV